MRTFTDPELGIVERSLEEAEGLVAARLGVSGREWGALPYDVRTLAFLAQEEVTDRAMAQVAKYECRLAMDPEPPRIIDFYRVCIQDHKVLESLERSRRDLRLEPFLLYILTHELIHVVRFSRALQHFEVTGTGRLQEEQRVHQQTFDCLQENDTPGLAAVLHAYRRFRQHPMRQ